MTDDLHGEWFDRLEEGVVLVKDGVVQSLNAAAARMLDVDPRLARGAPLISVLRDHRLEAAVTLPHRETSVSKPGLPATAPANKGAERLATDVIEIDLNGRAVQALPVPGGLLLRDHSAARQSERDARELLAVLSHELRTPVAAIVAVLEVLALDLAPGQRDDFLRRANEEAARLGRLIADLTVEVRPPRQRSVALAETVARAVALTETVRTQHGVGIETTVAPGAAWVDPDKLLQALVNLIENAAIHGPDDDLVEVVADLSHALVRVEVRDHGVPLEPSLALSLFDTTSQLSAKARGTGLGLRIVRSLAKAWGGDVWAGPRTDGVRGNAFGFSVPSADRR